MSLPLLATKFYIPPQRVDIITRPRLIQTLQQGLDRPGAFVLLSGPAGFGKTTLLSEFAGLYKGAVAWLSLDGGDNDPSRFWAHLIAAIQTVQRDFGETAAMLFLSPQPPPGEAVVQLLINDLAELRSNLFLILDDYHVIHNDAIQSAIVFLLEHSPEKLRLIVSTRIDPPWPLARFRARNRLVEIRALDLRFSQQEAADFLNRMTGFALTDADIAALEERTEGWIAGLQLAALSMKGRKDISAFIQAFTGSHIFIAEYLIEEVLNQQAEEIQQFLLQTSILDRLCAGVCEAVSGCADGHSMLAALYHANLFIDSLDDQGEWFRYHTLFGDLLRARLQRSRSKAEIAALHRRAAAWYQAQGMVEEAVRHALDAGDYPLAVTLVEKVALPMVMKAYFKTVEDWLQAIPPEYLNENPRMNMALAWMHLMRRDFKKASPYLDRLQNYFSTISPDAIDSSLRGEWLALQSMLLNAQGKLVESREVAELALSILPEGETKVRGMTYMGLAEAYLRTFQYERAEEACQQIIRQGRLAGDVADEMFGLSYLGLMQIQQGKLRAAYEISSDVLRRIEQAGSFSPFSATLYGELAEVYYQWHQIEKAQLNYERSVELSVRGGFSDAEIYHSVFLSRLYQSQGNLPASLQEIEKALDRMRTAAPAFVKEEVIAQQVSIFLAAGRAAAAQAALEPFGFRFDGGFTAPSFIPGESLPHEVGILYNAALRILLTQAVTRKEPGGLKDAIELADRVIEGSMNCRQLPVALTTRLLKSQIYGVLGDEEQSRSELIQTLELAEPEGYISVFVEEGKPIADALAALLKSDSSAKSHAEYIREILAAFPIPAAEETPGAKPAAAPPGSPLVEPLTPRELEVLQLIADGESNRAIAEKLFITVSAVKKHTGNIYGKLNVSSRTQALARARQLHLLPADE